MRLAGQRLREKLSCNPEPAFDKGLHNSFLVRSRSRCAARCVPCRIALACAKVCPPTFHSEGALPPTFRFNRRPVQGVRVRFAATRTAGSCSEQPKRIRFAMTSIRDSVSPSMSPAPSPVCRQAAQNRICDHRGKCQIQQARTVRHADFKAQAERFLVNPNDASHLGLHLPPFEDETQPHGLPRRGQFAANNLDHACPASIPRCRSARAAGPSLPSPPSKRSIIGGARPRSSCSTESAPSGSRRTDAT